MKKMIIASLALVLNICHAQSNTTTLFRIPNVYQIYSFKKNNIGIVNGNITELGNNFFATSCHVILNSKKTEIAKKEYTYFHDTVFVSSHDICFLGDFNTSFYSFRAPKIGERIMVVGVYDNQPYRSEGIVDSFDGILFSTTASWPKGLSGGAIVADDGGVLGLATFKSILASSEKHYAVSILSALKTKSEVIPIKTTRSISLYEGKILVDSDY